MPHQCADFATALVHEFVHVLGFKDGALEKQTSPTNCAIHLPDNGTINGNVCQHELEFVYAVYGFRLAPGTNFWSTPVVTGLTVSPLTVTVQVDQTQTVVPSLFVFGRQMTGSAPLGSASVIWTSDNTAIASVNSTTGVIKGIGTGSTIVRGKVSNLGSAYQLGTLMSSKGQEIPVTVTPGPPPGTGFRVTAINGVTSPVTVAGTYPIYASVTQQPTGTLQIAWKIVYSTAPQDTIRTLYGPNSYSLKVPAGSYTVRVYATPRGGSGTPWIYGTEGIQDFAVCTGGGGGGGGNLAAPVGNDGTDAVAGC
ncbi:MAG: Ig-like domain-containing protein [Gemmatimonadota bacterium]